MTEYDRSQMLTLLEKHFDKLGYDTHRYFDFGQRSGEKIRVPLYCKSRNKDSFEEAVVDIITERRIPVADYMPDLTVSGVKIPKASSVKFFQYYLPRAQVFWAYGSYAGKEKQDFDCFRETCEKSGIGLLEVSKTRVIQVLAPKSLTGILEERTKDAVTDLAGGQPWVDQLVQRLSDLNERCLQEYLHYVVYYGDPQFRRREITAREAEDVSPLLINRLQGLAHIAYAQELGRFAKEFRRRSETDYEIAYETIRSLWNNRLGIDYPPLQKDFEVVLRLEPRYRDHFLHQFQVFLLGAIIIDSLYQESWVRDFRSRTHSNVEDAWLAASTYHDFNYPVQEWENWTTKFLERTFHANTSSASRHLRNPDLKNQIIQLDIGKVVVRDEFVSKVSRLCSSIGCEFDDKFQRFVLRQVAIQRNHGVIGAFTFLEKFSRSPLLTQTAITEASASILLHDEVNWQCFCGNRAALSACTGVQTCTPEEEEILISPFLREISLKSKPLGFLLIFCDTTQEWGREWGEKIFETPLLRYVDIGKKKVFVHILVREPESFRWKRDEVERVGKYLRDPRFVIRISPGKGARTTDIPMTGPDT